MRTSSWIVLALPFFYIPTAYSVELDVNEGLYDITIQTAMPGMALPEQKMRECITQADKKDPQRLMKKGSASDDCALQNVKQEKDKLSFSISCPKEKMTGQGNYLFAGNTYSGKMQMSIPNPQGGQPMTMTVNTTSKWVGPCK
ncbi:MAG: DUF3617 family protein [Magnetococcales bacterium]|nr:DUF3617 family protein [Magnetococcales bacterium]MBF0439640.1 DUF3617 family protein [Magnetococcales bacterium]